MQKISEDHTALCGKLTEQHEIILDLIGGRSFHHVDIPVHGNIGDRIFARLWTRYSRRLVADAVKLVCTHESVTTNRLHGDILACLLDKPNTVVDNRYGNNFSYIEAWIANSQIVSLTGDQNEKSLMDSVVH